MNVLIGNGRLEQYAGTETWCRTMYHAMEALGHKPWLYSPVPIRVFTELRRVESKSELKRRSLAGGFDLALLNHAATLAEVASWPIGFRIVTVHGVGENEQPGAGANRYVAVSEEIARQYHIQHVIPQPIDSSLYVCSTLPSMKIAHILWCSNYQVPPLRVALEAAAAKIGATFQQVGGETHENRIHPDELPTYCERADVVVGVGRTALEAMSCARPVLVAGVYGIDGMVTPDNVARWGQKNWSGRNNGYCSKLFGSSSKNYQRELELMIESAIVSRQLELYTPEHGAALRRYVRENHNPINVAAAYLQLMRGGADAEQIKGQVRQEDQGHGFNFIQ